MKPGLRILFTNNTLAGRAGSELYVRDLAIALMRRGHFPMAYSSVLGEVAEELREATIPVMDDLNQLGVVPDLIHAQHHLDAMAAMLHFPDVPAVLVCHGWAPWEEAPVVFPTIRRYVAVDDLCRERLLSAGVPAERIETLYNFVDLARFPPRTALPERPRTALVFSNYVQESPVLRMIREACSENGIERVDVLGMSMGTAVREPGKILGNYDLVFAKARGALEAMAVGCATVVTDYAGFAGLVTPGNLQALRRLNFGVRSLQQGAVTPENLRLALQAYSAAEAVQVSAWIRRDADLHRATERWLEIYAGVRADWARESCAGPEQLRQGMRCASAYLRQLAPPFKSRYEAGVRLQELEARCAALTQQLEAGRLDCEELARVKASRSWRLFGLYRALWRWLGRR